MLFSSAKKKLIRLLRGSERYTKTDMVYLTREGSWSLLGQIIGSLSSFIVVILLANLVSKEVLGQYRFILSIVPLLTLFTLPDIGTAITRTVARGIIPNLREIVKTKIRWGFLGSMVAIIMAVYYFYAGNMLLKNAFLVTALFLPFLETYYVYFAYFKGKQDFKTAALYDAVSRIFQSAFLVSVALLTENILLLLVAFLGGQVITRFYFYKKMLPLVEKDGPVKISINDDPIHYGKRLSVLGVLSTLKDNWDKLLVWHFLGSEMLAIYYIALMFPKNIILFFNVIPRVAFPKFSKNSWEEDEKMKIVKKMGLLFLLLILPASIYVFIVPFVIPFIFSTYEASILPASILSIIIVTSPLNAMISYIMYAQKSIKKLLILQGISIITFTAIFLIVHSSLGISRASIALVGSEMVLLVTGIILVWPSKKRSFKNVTSL